MFGLAALGSSESAGDTAADVAERHATVAQLALAGEPEGRSRGKPTEPTAQQTAKQAAELCLPISGIHAFPRLNGSRETKLSAELLQVVQPTCKQLFVMLSFKKHF